VVKAVGLRGEVKLRTAEDFWEAALASRQLALEMGGARRPVSVVAEREQGPGAWILRFAGTEDRTAAEALVGADLFLTGTAPDVPLPARPRPFQLRGLRVVRLDGTPAGEITGILPAPQPLLVVRNGEREHLVPWVGPIVAEIDLEAGLVRIDPPAGLLEI
jgi:16S rRNA processing protein RimM